mmetsp:Transcript_41563/g.74575  ORF Transcript_41563/g.74575 Transcript_41563/m.74575 type:complete len:99 (+) Transcript_41563:934-1230(+)
MAMSHLSVPWSRARVHDKNTQKVKIRTLKRACVEGWGYMEGHLCLHACTPSCYATHAIHASHVIPTDFKVPFVVEQTSASCEGWYWSDRQAANQINAG